jgi:uncharacterized protein (DUF924 family)
LSKNRAEEILEFWFGAAAHSQAAASERRRLWFGGDPETDRLIDDRYGRDLEAARRGGYDRWSDNPRGALALIVVLDQFSRNIFRGSPQAYESDSKALALCREGMAQEQDRSLEVVERAFFYLPLEHAEDRVVQRLSVQAFTRLCREAPPEWKGMGEGFLDYAVRHQHIVERFGRFPHRNAVLGRLSTPEEKAFLLEPGSSF